MELNRTLGLAFHGPLQSWGAHSKLGVRETASSPTRSGILGLIRAALGDDREGTPELLLELDRVEIATRTDRAGERIRDLHNITAGSAYLATGTPYGETIMSHRWYLSDAAFLVLVAVPEPDPGGLLDRITRALEHPRWHLALGRRSCPPAEPLVLGTMQNHPLDVADAAPIMSTTDPPDQVNISVSGGLAVDAEERGWDPTAGTTTPTRPLPARRWSSDTTAGFLLSSAAKTVTDPVGLAQWFRENSP